MRQLHFKYAKAQNFLCFGVDPIEIHFENYGNIVLIRGTNLDATNRAEDTLQDEEEIRVASNGVGKSSIPEILVYGLYGKTIKKPKKIGHDDVINNQVGKKLYVEVIWDKYRVVRTRKTDTLRLWENENGVWDKEHEITLGGMPATQKLIEEKLGLSYEAFVNIVVFTDDNSSAFLECDAANKRQIVENLLSLEKYRDYSENAKKMAKDARDKIKIMAKEYELLLHDKTSCEARVVKIEQQQNEWKVARLDEFKKLAAMVKTTKDKLGQSDEGKALLAWQEAKDKLVVLNKEMAEIEGKLEKSRTQVDAAKEKYHLLLQKDGIISAEIRRHQQTIKDLQYQNSQMQMKLKDCTGQKDGVQCPACYGMVDKKNFLHVIQHTEQSIKDNDASIVKNQAEIKIQEDELKKHRLLTAKLKEGIDGAQDKIALRQERLREIRGEIKTHSQVREPHADSASLLLEQQITELKRQALQKKTELEGPSPFVEILKAAQADVEDRAKTCIDKDTEIKTAESELPYFEYWIKAFGDNGIRKFVIDGIIPSLNSRIAYWLQFLIENKLDLTFNNQLEENIQRCPADGSPFIYFVLSNGQRRRLNLSVSQAFAYVMMLNCGASPSLVFLDEVTTNIDPMGVQGIYNMICELAKEKQVFVTTHDHDLLSLLHGCDTINLKMKNGVTSLV